MEEKEFLPDYMKIIKALRSIGHLPQDAIRDIVDNGFDAGATEVGVYFNEKPIKGKERKALENVIIVDNGKGMSKFELTKSLVPADTGRDRNSEVELGKFGIGLLASGLSFANKIEVITKGVNGYFYTYISYS
jgi:HSP90 family molecular chaperone